MTSYLFLILVAILGGIAVTLQAQFMGVMDKSMGTVESVFITYGSGGLVIGLTMLALRGGNLAAWKGVPWYVLTAGILGLIIVGTIGFSVPRLGIVPAFTVLVATQFIVGALIDHFGLLGADLRPLDLPRAIGVLIVLVGIWLILR